jgi:lipopolysaccharide transport system ATP-binding protein
VGAIVSKFGRPALREELRVVPANARGASEAVVPKELNLAISAEKVRMDYPLGPYNRGSLKEALFGVLGRKDREPPPKYVTAIRGIDFHASFGERVALIGHNGSGKSSLLRVLAGIYPLSSGDVTVTGRIGTLLDIGLGFETEATGRENIYYRGMTMGYSRGELAKVEEQIVQFADLGEFIDLPMRTYSAGMYVRLGFAISTEFAPEILLVDEVFSAGDAAFANRALHRMMSIVERSGILIMATHDLALVEKICTRVIWLERGQIVRDGSPAEVLPEYLNMMTA